MRNIIFSVIAFLLIAGCSATQQSVDEGSGEGEEIYVFDDVSEVIPPSGNNTAQDTLTLEQNPPADIAAPNFLYYVQIGAFTSRERAERFALLNKDKCNYPMNISYNDDVQLWVIRLPKLSSRSEAEKIRDELWKIEEFKDAFIVTIEE